VFALCWVGGEENRVSDFAELVVPAGGVITTVAQAEQTLEAINAAETWEVVWERAKDPLRLMQAIDVKLRCQTAYAVWRLAASTHGTNQYQRKEVLEQGLPTNDPGRQVIHRWRKALCKTVIENRRKVWAADDDKLAAVLTENGKRCVRIVEQEKDGTIRGTEGTGEFERYTPAEYIEYARDVMGSIDLDPATSEYAQETVQAAQYFTVEDDGLTRDWHGRVWINPPYHRELAPAFVRKLISELRAERVSEAIMLTNNVTDTTWFQEAADFCDGLCFTAGRIRFEVPDAEPVLPTQGQAFFYFGRRLGRFFQVFREVGFCVEPLRDQEPD
jgi:phage N-6-adenine-methyltransferase